MKFLPVESPISAHSAGSLFCVIAGEGALVLAEKRARVLPSASEMSSDTGNAESKSTIDKKNRFTKQLLRLELPLIMMCLF